jgi:hypothetical protein
VDIKKLRGLSPQANYTGRATATWAYLAHTHFRITDLIGRKSELSTNKLFIHKTILIPIWTYGIQLWRTISTSNIELPERFQSNALRMILDALRYVSSTVIRRDLQTPTVKEEICRYSSQYSYSVRLSAHPNDLTVSLMELLDNRRLRRHLPNDLHVRFLV